MTNTYERYAVTVRTLTPMHIGNGRVLLNQYDYAVKSARTWRINEYEFLDVQNVDDPAIVAMLERTAPAELLKDADFVEGSPLFRYVMKGTPRSSGKGAELREQVKSTLGDSPYLPGTALKGALRTALAWHGWEQQNMRADASRLNRRREFAAQAFERDLFGPNPNTDLLRALIVSDSEPVGQDRLMVANARVLTAGNKQESPIEVEAIRPDTSFKLTVKIDRMLFSDWARKRGLQLAHEDWLDGIASITHRHAKERIDAELKWFGAAQGATTPATVYRELSQSALKASPSQCLVQLGWGTGWGSKTFGSRLTGNEIFMDRIIADYRLAKGSRMAGDAFPKSRRVTMSYLKDAAGNASEVPGYPMGWAWASFKRMP